MFKPLTAILLLCALALGCGGSDTTNTSIGGAAGSTSNSGGCTHTDIHDVHCTFPSTSSGGAEPTIVGPSCSPFETPLAPIQPGDVWNNPNVSEPSPVTDENDNPINENGALAVRCIDVVAPIHAIEVCYSVVRGSICTSHTHTAWVTQETALPAELHLDKAIATRTTQPVDLAYADDGTGGTWEAAEVCLPLDIDATAGVLCLAVQLPVTDSTNRACIAWCHQDAPEADEHDLYSNTVDGLVVCPDADGGCALEPLTASPTTEIGKAFANAQQDLRVLWKVQTL